MSTEEKIKMARQADDFYLQKYKPLTAAYLDNVSKEANLDDVLNGICTVDHANAITNYSGQVSGELNRSLRGDYLALTEHFKSYELIVAQALDSLPAFNDEVVYRMEKYGPEPAVYEKYFDRQKEVVLSIPCYLSTSKEDWDCTKVVYRIKTLVKDSHARDISRISNMAREKEVLFAKNTNFLVKAIEKTTDKMIIVMEETKEAASAVLNYYDDPDNDHYASDEEPGLFD